MSEPPRKRMVRPASGGGRPAARGAKRLKTAGSRTASSQAWLERQLNDPFAAEARAKGYRSRAAFKLIELDDRFSLIGPARGRRPWLRAGRLASGRPRAPSRESGRASIFCRSNRCAGAVDA